MDFYETSKLFTAKPRHDVSTGIFEQLVKLYSLGIISVGTNCVANHGEFSGVEEFKIFGQIKLELLQLTSFLVDFKCALHFV